MLVSTRVPSGSMISDLSIVHHAGQPVVVCADGQSGVWAWRPSSGEWTLYSLPFAHAEDPVLASFPHAPHAENTIDMVAALSVNGELLVAAGGDEQEPAAWNLQTGDLLWRTPVTGAYLSDVIALDGAFIIAQQYSGEVRLWSPDGVPTLLGEAGDDYACLGRARVDGRDLIVTGSREVEVWDVDTLAKIAEVGPDDRVMAVAACALADRVVVLAGTYHGKLWAWGLDAGLDWETDYESGEPLYKPVTVANTYLKTMAVMAVAGRMLALTPAPESMRMWNVADGIDAGRVHTPGHNVTAMDTALIDGRPVLVAGGNDGVLRIWDESDLVPFCNPASQ